MKIFLDRNESSFREMILSIQSYQEKGLSNSGIQEKLKTNYEEKHIAKYSGIIAAVREGNETYWHNKNAFKLFVLIAFFLNTLIVTTQMIEYGPLAPRAIFHTLAWIFSFTMAYYTNSRETGGVMYLIPILLVINPVFLELVVTYDTLLSTLNITALLYLVFSMPFMSGIVFGLSLYNSLPFDHERVQRVLTPPPISMLNPEQKHSGKLILLMGFSYVPLFGIIPALSLGFFGVRKERYDLVLISLGGLLCTLGLIVLARMSQG